MAAATAKNNKKAVISPNLLPPEEKEKVCVGVYSDTIKRVLLVGTGFLILFWAVGAVLLFRISHEKGQIVQKLSQEIDSEKVKELGSINRENRDMANLASKVENFRQGSFTWSRFLGELAKITPPGVAFFQIETETAKPGWIKISGIASQRNKFLEFKDKLEKASFCDKVESPLSNYVSAEGLKFDINIALKGWRPVWEEDLLKKAKKSTIDQSE
jgi:hypothetical protein